METLQQRKILNVMWLLVLLSGVVLLYLNMNNKNKIFPLLAPMEFIDIFQAYNYKNHFSSILGMSMLNESGYITGADGSKVSSGHSWIIDSTKERVLDEDVSLIIVYYPSIKLAEQNFSMEKSILNNAQAVIEVAINLGISNADEALVTYMKDKSVSVMRSRYRNYIFVVASINSEDLVDFDSRIINILENSLNM